MELILWWLPLVLLGSLLLLAAIAWLVQRQRRQRPPSRGLPLANSRRLLRLPAYQHQLRRHLWLVRGLLLVLILGIASTLVLSGRLARHTLTQPEMKNRDIILCLDVSGSMNAANAKLTGVYGELAKKFNGERLGLVVFDSSPVVIFPLTNDYAFISERLTGISDIFGRASQQKKSTSGDPAADIWTNKRSKEEIEASRNLYDLLEGTNEGSGSSLIGDGLAGCINRFDTPLQKRSRSIIFGTDNYLAGNPLVTLQEAAEVARSRDIRAYGINPADGISRRYRVKEAEEFKDAMLLTNGDYYTLDAANAPDEIIAKITAQDATRFKGSPQLITIDTPQVLLFIIAGLTTAMLLLIWRLRL